MARNKPNLPSPASSSAGKGRGGWLITLAVLTLLAVGTGALFGRYLVSTVEKAIDEKNKTTKNDTSQTLVYASDMVLKSVAPIVTNLSGSTSTFIRLESSIVFKNGALENPDIVTAEIRQDVMAYLRTLSLAQIQGASGLQHLREDLNERVTLRSKGSVRELILETIVVQ